MIIRRFKIVILVLISVSSPHLTADTVGSEGEIISQVTAILDSIDMSQDVLDKIIVDSKELMVRQHHAWQSGTADPREWHVFVSDDTIMLVSRKEFDYGAAPHFLIKEAICKSHIPPFNLVRLHRVDSFRDDPILDEGTALFGELKCRVVLSQPIKDWSINNNLQLRLLVSHSKIINLAQPKVGDN